MTLTRLGILISGRGSNMQSIVAACETSDVPAEVAVVVSNEPEAPGVEWAMHHGIATAVLPYKFNNSFKATTNPIYQLKVEGNNLTNLDVKCYEIADGKYAIESSQNTEAVFESDKSGLIKQLFKSLKDFAVTNKK